MKVALFKTVDVEAEASVGIEDIRAALEDHLTEVADGETTHYSVAMFINSVYQCFSAPTDAMIAQISPYNRAIICAKFREQADRYATR